MRGWLEDFTGYRIAVTEGRSRDGLDSSKSPIAIWLLASLMWLTFVGNDQIAAAFRSALNALPGWHRDESRRAGKWFFVAFSGSAGEKR